MGFTYGTIISIALMTASYFIARSKKPKSLGQDAPTTLTERGVWLPLILGTQKTGYAFSAIGQRVSRSVGGGKGSGGGSGGEAYDQAGWHIIGPGPATGLVKILMNNRPIWTQELSSDTTPSGSMFDLPNGGGSFQIYWGDEDQPINEWIARKTGIRSRWEGYFFIVWYAFDLGTSPTWPQVEYVVRYKCPTLSLSNSEYELTPGTTTGINLGHALLQLLCAPYPLGLSISPNNIDNDTLEAIGTLAETENLAVNVRIEGGDAAQNAVASMLQDAGVLMPEYENRLAFIPTRPVDSGDVITLSDDVIAPPLIEPTVYHGESDKTRAVFSYLDETKNWRAVPIPFDDDGEISEIGTVSTTTVNIENFTDATIANEVANRRSQEAESKASFKMRGLRGSKLLYVGQVFRTGYTGQSRVMSVKPSDESPEVEIEFATDIYGLATIPDSLGELEGSPVDLDAEPDEAFTWFEIGATGSGAPIELPFGASSDSNQIVVLRTRKHQQIAGARVYISVGGTAYVGLGAQTTAAAGGLIDTAIDDLDSSPISVGPAFEDTNGDAENIMDLSGDPDSHAAGVQIAVINDEVFFLESVSVVSETDWAPSTSYSPGDVIIPLTSTGFRYICTTGGTSAATEPTWDDVKGGLTNDGTVVWETHYFKYQMNNLIRANWGTVAADHAVDDRVYITRISALARMESPLMTAGANLCIKTQPYTTAQLVTLASVTAVCKTFVGT